MSAVTPGRVAPNRAACVSSGTTLADPVREVVFTFYHNALYPPAPLMTLGAILVI